MAEDTIDAALSNLDAIKQGDDPRTKDTQGSENAATIETPAEITQQSADALQVAVAEVDRLFEEVDIVSDNIPERERIHTCIARWERKNGVCKYDKKPPKQQFGKRLSNLSQRFGHHTIAINAKILEEGNRDGFIDTVRHELAHVVAFAKYDGSQGHNNNWKNVAVELGADPSSCHSKKSTDHNYYIGCPNCGTKTGRLRRSKVIKQPFNRKCGTCGESRLVSYDAGDPMPEENGTVAVDSIPWNNREEWFEHRNS
jgi:predicted SprT family Zn-dependent metalloprotease